MPGDTAAVYAAMERFRRGLLAGERQMMREMARRWVQVERALEDQLLLLAQEMATRQAQGLPVGIDQVRRSLRYQRLLAQVEAEMRQFGKAAADLVAQRQRALAAAGVENAAQLVSLSLGQGIGIGFDVLPVDALIHMAGYMADGSPLQQYFVRRFGPAAAQGVMDGLLKGVALGWNPRKTAMAMRKGLGLPMRTALNAARTETLRVYRESSLAQYRESGVVEGYLRLCAKDTRTCVACLAMDGQWFPLSTSFEEHNLGRCAAVPALEGQRSPFWQQTGEQYFNSLGPDAQQRMMGKKMYELWRGRQIAFRDVATLHEDPVWGNAWQRSTIEQAKRNARRRRAGN